MAASQSRKVLDDDPFAVNLDCIHCGLCLPKCPTYQELGSEPDSPRGRIHIMRAAEQGRIELDQAALAHLDGCLACRACESACPSGVRYELMLTATRDRWRRENPPGWLARLAFDGLLPHPGRLRASARLLRLYQRSGLQRLVRSSRVLGLVPSLRQAEAKLPEVPPQERLKDFYPARGTARKRVGFLSGCVMPVLFPEVHRASIEVLRKAGCEVVVPRGQTCCGALHSHDGLHSRARRLAQRNLSAFGDDLDAIVVNSAGCGAALKDYPHWKPDNQQARRFALRVKDISQWLAELQPRWTLRPLPLTAAYDDACHLLHGQRVSSQPRQLLKSIPELRLPPVPNADRCCGAAGLYTLHQPEMSERLLQRKMKELLSVQPDRIVSANPGCLLQFRYGIKTLGLSIRAQHPVELLGEALDEA
ncbi:MAG TPA: (Fe-S)-binding protein [Acidobacteriota bacterium]|nr:(Fe-S)-binding protein [Acidobacteriota bacterium]